MSAETSIACPTLASVPGLGVTDSTETTSCVTGGPTLTVAASVVLMGMLAAGVRVNVCVTDPPMGIVTGAPLVATVTPLAVLTDTAVLAATFAVTGQRQCVSDRAARCGNQCRRIARDTDCVDGRHDEVFGDLKHIRWVGGIGSRNSETRRLYGCGQLARDRDEVDADDCPSARRGW